MSNIVTVRDIETVTAEIKTIHSHTQRMMLSGAIEIGRRLVEAKSMVAHGEWGKYLEEQVSYSVSTANNLMKLFQEYGNNQTSLFDDFANSQTFQNLTYTKALAMLALPAEMRQSFAEENDVEHMSTRELQGAIQEELDAVREKNGELERALIDAQEDNEVLRGNLDEMRGDVRDAQQETEEIRQKLESAQTSEKAALEQVDKLKKQVETAKQKEQKAKDALKQAQEHPEIPESLMEEMRQQVAAQAAKEATEKLEKKLADAENTARNAARQREIAEVQIEELEKQLRASSPNMIRLGNYLEAMQEAWEKFVDVLKDIREEDPETADKLKANAKVKVLEPMAEQLSEV